MDYYVDECLRLADEMMHAAVRKEPFTDIRQSLRKYLEDYDHSWPVPKGNPQNGLPEARRTRIDTLRKELDQLLRDEDAYQKEQHGEALLNGCTTLLKAGKKNGPNGAIALYRITVGCSLTEARDAVERMVK